MQPLPLDNRVPGTLLELGHGGSKRRSRMCKQYVLDLHPRAQIGDKGRSLGTAGQWTPGVDTAIPIAVRSGAVQSRSMRLLAQREDQIVHRRAFLATGLAALAALKSNAALSRDSPHVFPSRPSPASANAVAELVRRRAEELSRQDFKPVQESLAAPLAAMGYDEYRDLRFRPERAVWRGEELGFELQFFPSAYIYRTPVVIFLVENDAIRLLTARCSTSARSKARWRCRHLSAFPVSASTRPSIGRTTTTSC